MRSDGEIHLVIMGIIIDVVKLPVSQIRPQFSWPPGNITMPGNTTIPGTNPWPGCASTQFNGTEAMRIGFKYLTCPGGFVQYRGIEGATGKVLGIWSVLMQVCDLGLHVWAFVVS